MTLDLFCLCQHGALAIRITLAHLYGEDLRCDSLAIHPRATLSDTPALDVHFSQFLCNLFWNTNSLIFCKALETNLWAHIQCSKGRKVNSQREEEFQPASFMLTFPALADGQMLCFLFQCEMARFPGSGTTEPWFMFISAKVRCIYCFGRELRKLFNQGISFHAVHEHWLNHVLYVGHHARYKLQRWVKYKDIFLFSRTLWSNL